MKHLTEMLKGVLWCSKRFKQEKPGTYMYSCWMGMIRGVIILKEA
ncbi:hypothetical protein ACFTQL_17770 [Peribacillus butanolivorans]